MKIWKAMFVSLALALAMGLSAAPAAHAQMEGEAELSAMMAKNQAYLEMMIEAQTIFLDALNHVGAATEKAEAPVSKAEAQAWSAAWETQARARVAKLKQRLATAPRVTSDEARKVLGPTDTRGLGDLMASTPKLVEDTLEAAENTVNQTAALAPLAASGDRAAAEKLTRQGLAVSLYMVEIENQNLRNAIATVGPGHPQRSLAQSILATNLAAMEIQRVVLRGYNGEDLDAEAAAGRVRTHLSEAEVAAKRIPAEARALIALAAKETPREGKGMMDKLRTAFKSYDRSAEVELSMIRSLREAASGLDKQDFEKVAAALAKSSTLIDERITLQTTRAGALSQ